MLDTPENTLELRKIRLDFFGTTEIISTHLRMLERHLRMPAPYRQVVIAGLGGDRTGREEPNGQWWGSGRWALALLPVSPAT